MPARIKIYRARSVRIHIDKIRLVACLSLLLLFPTSPLNSKSAPLTVEPLLRAPCAISINVSAESGRIAWLVQEGPIQRIWTAELPSLSPKLLVEFPPDDGQPITSIRLSPNGAWLAYVRGLPPRATGIVPNPATLVVPPERGLWLIPTAGGRPRLLGAGTDQEFSPDSRLLTFVRGGTQILSLNISERTENEPKTLLTVKGGISGFAWSPDGRRLALANDRGRYSVIGIWTTGADRMRWVSPDTSRDVLPVWSPQGRRLAFVRLSGQEMGRGHDVMDSAPFSIMVSGGDGSPAREIWSSPAPADSAMQEELPAEGLRWLGEDRLAFYSEHEGWKHIYAVSAEGGTITSLTPGPYESDASSLSPDRSFLVVSSNSGNLERRRLWRVSTRDGAQTPLTGPDTIDTDPVIFPDGRHVAYRSASTRTAQVAVVRDLLSGEERRLGPRPAEGYPAASLVEPKSVKFRAPDGLTVYGILFVPGEIPAGGRVPAIVYVHGGPVRQMMLGWHPMLHYGYSYLLNQVLASRGYMVLAVNYRSGTGYGRAFREAPGRNTRGANEYQDVLAAARYLQSLPQVDPKRIGIYGPSFGGYLTGIALGRDSDVFQAGVDWYGVHDWAEWAKGTESGFVRTDFGTNPDNPAQLEVARKSSPVAWVETWRSPVLLIHGGDDRTVLVDETIDLAVKLRRRGVKVETLIFPDEQHGFALFESWRTALNATADFFDRHLSSDKSAKRK